MLTLGGQPVHVLHSFLPGPDDAMSWVHSTNAETSREVGYSSFSTEAAES